LPDADLNEDRSGSRFRDPHSVALEQKQLPEIRLEHIPIGKLRG